MRSFMNSMASMGFMSARCLRKIQMRCKVSLSNKRSSRRVPDAVSYTHLTLPTTPYV